MRNLYLFIRAVLRHWAALVTGGFVIALLGIWQGAGHSVQPNVYWLIALMSFFVACFRAWNDEHEDKTERQQLADWTRKWERAVDALKKICPGYVMTSPGSSTNADGLVFSEPLRQRIDHHLGKKASFTGKLQPKALSKDDLLNPVVQEVITEELNAVEKFKKEHTDWSRSLKLLP